MEGPHFLNPMVFSIELAFTLIAIISCFLIYRKTKESYELTKHKGIQYFRDAFLFFGLSYTLRFFFSIIMLSTVEFELIMPGYFFSPWFILLLGYFSTMGIFYLIFSSVWKSFDNKKMLIFGHSIAILLSLISFFTRSHFMLINLQCALLITAAILGFVMHLGKNKLSQIKILYLLVSGLWLINLLVINQRRPFMFGIEIFFYIVSLIVFIVIYSKVSKWVK